MAFFESIAVYSWLLVWLGGPRQQILPWNAVCLIGMLGVALPNGLAYWRRWDQVANGTWPSAIG